MGASQCPPILHGPYNVYQRRELGSTVSSMADVTDETIQFLLDRKFIVTTFSALYSGQENAAALSASNGNREGEAVATKPVKAWCACKGAALYRSDEASQRRMNSISGILASW